MTSRRFSLELGLRILLAAACMGLFSHFASAGWVIESETITPALGVPIKTDKDGKTVAGRPEPAPIKKYTMWLQDKNVRVDLANITMIVDGESDEQYLILHDKTQYVLMTKENVDQARQAAKDSKAPKEQRPEAAEKIKPTKTDKTETISGYKTQAWEAVLPDRKVTFWITQEGKDPDKLRDAMLEAYSRVMATSDESIDIKSLPGYPIRAVIETNPQKTTLKNGMVIATAGKKTTHTVTSIKAQDVDSDKFKVPTGYERTTLLPRFEPKPDAKTMPPATDTK